MSSKALKNRDNNVKNVIATNNYLSRYNDNKITTHAEMNAIKQLAIQMCRVRVCRKTVDLIVIRVNKNGQLTMSQPCYHCAKELVKNKKIKIRHLYFSNKYGTIEKHNFLTWYNMTNHHISSGWLNKRN